MWVLLSLVASLVVVGLEYVYRIKLFPSYLAGWWLLFPASLAIQSALFYSYRDAPKLLVAWSTFFLLNAMLRVGVSTLGLHESFTPRTGLALGLIILGAVLIRR